MTPLEQFKADKEYNQNNILFTMEDDEAMGEREQGFYTKFIMDNGHQCRRFIFDNGHRYLLDIEEETLYPCEPVLDEYFIHKYLEKVVSNFISQWELNPSESLIYCTEDEVSVRSIIKLQFNRDQRVVFLPNIMIPINLKHKGLGKKMIWEAYQICKQFEYRLVLVQMVESFFNSLQKRNAKIIDFETVEITSETKLL